MQVCKILSVVGARPNFMKIAPFIKAIAKHNSKLTNSPDRKEQFSGSADPYDDKLIPEDFFKIEHILVHTGQHYDVRMSGAFFKELDIPDPDINLEVGSGSHAEQVGFTMIEFEKVLREYKPDWVVVVGDVNATLACSVTARKEEMNLCHIEAGLRSGDMTMPEEINRLVTDRLSNLLLTPDLISSENLRKEGTPEENIKFVGNIMIDTLEANREKAASLALIKILEENLVNGFNLQKEVLKDDHYVAITLHRPSNVDKRQILEPLVSFLLEEVIPDFPLIWPVHPRTRKLLIDFGLWGKVIQNPNVLLLEPVSYHQMLRITMGAKIIFTDSGGLQEECCVLGVPCLTLRWNTERPITLAEHGGASVLVGNNVEQIRKAYNFTLSLSHKPTRPPLWDGHTAERCVKEILRATKRNEK